MPRELMTRAEFARHCQVKPSSISRALKGPLHKALSGDRVDAAHPSAIAYAQRRQAARNLRRHAPPVAVAADEAAFYQEVPAPLVDALHRKLEFISSVDGVTARSLQELFEFLSELETGDACPHCSRFVYALGDYCFGDAHQRRLATDSVYRAAHEAALAAMEG